MSIESMIMKVNDRQTKGTDVPAPTALFRHLGRQSRVRSVLSTVSALRLADQSEDRGDHHPLKQQRARCLAGSCVSRAERSLRGTGIPPLSLSMQPLPPTREALTPRCLEANEPREHVGESPAETRERRASAC